jgi:hypothetical protein
MVKRTEPGRTWSFDSGRGARIPGGLVHHRVGRRELAGQADRLPSGPVTAFSACLASRRKTPDRPAVSWWEPLTRVRDTPPP